MSKCIVCGRPVTGDHHQYCCHGCQAIAMIVDSMHMDENAKINHTQKLLKQLFGGNNFEKAELSMIDTFNLQTQFQSFKNNDHKTNLDQYEFQVAGMVCPACSWLIHHLLIKKNGIMDVNLNFISERCLVTYDPMVIGKDSIDNYIVQMGYQTLSNISPGKDFNYLRFGAGWFLALNSMMLAFLVYSAEVMKIPYELQLLCSFLLLLFATLTPMVAASQIYKAGWFQLKTFNFKMEALIVLSTFTAWLYSIFSLIRGDFAHLYFEVVPLLLMITETGNMITGLFYKRLYQRLTVMRLSIPKKVRLKREETYDFVEIKEVKSGDVFAVQSGEVIPLDGILLIDGEFDFSVITGESNNVLLKAGQFIGSGGKVLTNPVELIVPPGEVSSKVDTIIESTMSAFNSKKKVALWGDKISSYFVPLVLAISFITFFYFLQTDLFTAITRSMTVLIIACPCAFGIAEPLVMVFATEWAFEAGIQIFNGNALRMIPSIIVFDKTGTLTVGKPVIQKMIWLEKPADQYLDIISSLEYGVDHPVAQTLSEVGQIIKIDNKKIKAGQIEGEYDGKYYQIGKESLYPQVVIPPEFSDSSIVLFGDYDKCYAIIALEDKIRDEVKDIINQFKNYKIQPHICSGDRLSVVAKVSKILGVTDYLAHMSPLDKVQYIKRLQDRKAKVLMVGDGVNDSQAMMSADFGLCVFHGQAMTKLSADGVFLTNHIKGLPQLIGIMKAVRKKIILNYSWALLYNFIGIIFAITGVLKPSYGALAMALSNGFVIFNSSRSGRDVR